MFNIFKKNKIHFFIYINRFNEVKPYEVNILHKHDEEIIVYDLREKKEKTFITENILSQHSSFNDAENKSQILQKEYQILPRNVTGKTFANTDKKMEVCFTGFSKEEKKELIQIATDKNLFIRTDVSSRLSLLVCGPNTGPSKLKKAKSLSIKIINGKQEFINFLRSN